MFKVRNNRAMRPPVGVERRVTPAAKAEEGPETSTPIWEDATFDWATVGKKIVEWAETAIGALEKYGTVSTDGTDVHKQILASEGIHRVSNLGYGPKGFLQTASSTANAVTGELLSMKAEPTWVFSVPKGPYHRKSYELSYDQAKGTEMFTHSEIGRVVRDDQGLLVFDLDDVLQAYVPNKDDGEAPKS